MAIVRTEMERRKEPALRLFLPIVLVQVFSKGGLRLIEGLWQGGIEINK